jgi:GNAT superfamily N-acetyltransferase
VVIASDPDEIAVWLKHCHENGLHRPEGDSMALRVFRGEYPATSIAVEPGIAWAMRWEYGSARTRFCYFTHPDHRRQGHAGRLQDALFEHLGIRPR